MNTPEPSRPIIWASLVGVILMLALTAFSLWRFFTTPPAFTLTRSPLPQPNAWDDYVRAGALVTAVPGHDAAYDLKTPPAKVAELVRRSRPALDAFRAGMRHDYGVPPAMSVGTAATTHLAGLRQLARMLVAESRANLARGDGDAALQSLLDSLRLAVDVPRGGVHLDGLLGAALESTALSEMTYVGGHLDARQCRTAVYRLAELDRRRVPLAEILRMEHGSVREQMSAGRQLGMIPYSRGAALEWDRYMQEAQRQAGLSPAQRGSLPPLRSAVLQPLTGVYSRTFAMWDARSARWRLMRIELALRAYHLDHNRPAARLQDLVPQYLPAVPTDPCTAGAPLRYAGAPQTVAYSVGLDGRDDGGAAILWREILDRRSGDLVVQLGKREPPRP